MKGVRLWFEVLHYLFSGQREAGSLDITADDSFARVVIMTEYFQAFIAAAIAYRLKVQSLQETGGVCLSDSYHRGKQTFAGQLQGNRQLNLYDIESVDAEQQRRTHILRGRQYVPLNETQS